MTVEVTELKPCPFCGGEACCSPSAESSEPEKEDREPLAWGVGCSCTAFMGPWSTEAEAIAAWNTRASDARIAELEAWRQRQMSDHQRMLWVDDVRGVCQSPDMCFEYGEHVRCGPCAIKVAQANGAETDYSIPPDWRAKRIAELEAEVARLRAVLHEIAEVGSDVNCPDCQCSGNAARAALGDK